MNKTFGTKHFRSNGLSVAKLMLACASVAWLMACGDKPAAETPAAPPAAPPIEKPAEAPKPSGEGPAAAAVSDRVEDPSFELALKPTGTYSAGKVSSFALSLKPRGEYHVNQDYPFSVSLSSPGASFPKAELVKADAAEFTDNIVRVDVPFTPTAAGAQTISANVKFAVCTPETCVPDERTLALALAVE
jgi:hypothetical protein